MRVRALVLCAALGASGCIVEAPGTSRSSSGGGVTSPNVVTNVPPLSVQNGAILDDRLEIVGVKLEPGRALPGETVKVTTYFKVLEDINQDYLIFVHVEDVDGRVERMNLDHQPAGGNLPTSQWRKGQTIADTFQIPVPAGANLRGFNIWLGLWHEPTDTRMQLKNPEKVRHDGRNRILVASLPVSS